MKYKTTLSKGGKYNGYQAKCGEVRGMKASAAFLVMTASVMTMTRGRIITRNPITQPPVPNLTMEIFYRFAACPIIHGRMFLVASKSDIAVK